MTKDAGSEVNTTIKIIIKLCAFFCQTYQLTELLENISTNNFILSAYTWTLWQFGVTLSGGQRAICTYNQ